MSRVPHRPQAAGFFDTESTGLFYENRLLKLGAPNNHEKNKNEDSQGTRFSWWSSSGLILRCLGAFPKALDGNERGWPRDAFAKLPPGLPWRSTAAAPRAFALPSSHLGERVLASLRITGEARLFPAPLPPRGDTGPRRHGRCIQPPGHRRRQPHLSRLRPAAAGSGSSSSRPDAAAGSPPSSLSLATPTAARALGRARPLPSPMGRAGDLARGPRT